MNALNAASANRLRTQPLPLSVSGPAPLAAPARVTLRALDTFEGGAVDKVRAPAAPTNTDGLKTWGELSADQQALFGAGSATTYAALSTEQRAVFLNLTTRMAARGVDFGGLELENPTETIRRNRLLFTKDPEGLARLQSSLQEKVGEGTFFEDKVFAPFHPGMADFGVREDQFNWTMQFGIGDKGAFVDVDRFNYKAGVLGWLGHAAEIIHPARPSPFKVADELGIDLKSQAQQPKRSEPRPMSALDRAA